jgi:virulence-associated protein VapD
MAELRRYKAVNFDLDTKSLRDRFGENGRRSAYSAVGRFLKKSGFEHRQGSGYRSTSTMTDLEIADLIVSMYRDLEWLPDCVQKLDVTNIGREYDLDVVAKRRIEEERRSGVDITFDVELKRSSNDELDIECF